MRVATIPPLPHVLRAPGYTPAALAMRERFLRGCAAAYSQAGHSVTAASLSYAADVQAERHRSSTP